MISTKKRPALTTEERAKFQPRNNYIRVMHIRQAARLYMRNRQLMPFEAWIESKGIDIYEEVLR